MILTYNDKSPIWPIVILISAFTPYISPSSGVKGDNIIIILFAVYSLGILIIRRKLELNNKLITLFFLWFCAFSFLFIRTTIGGGYLSSYSFIAEIKNFGQPIALIFVFIVLFYKNDINSINLLLKKTCTVLIILLSVNTIWIFLGLFLDLSIVNQYFVRGVAINAAGNGRFTGIFNQPMESGISYSIGLFAWIYLFSLEKRHTSIKSVFLLISLIFGGLMSVSKVFVFGGLGIFLLNFFLRKNVYMRLKRILLWLLILVPIIFVYLVNSWTGIMYLNRYFDLDNYRNSSVLDIITSGRYGEEESQQEVLFNKVWKSSPIVGEGMGSQIVYDSAFFHFFSSGGSIALLIYILLIIYFLLTSVQAVFYKFCSDEAFFYINIVLIIIIASLGSPILIINRASVIVWVFLLILISIIHKKKKNFSRL